MGGGVRPDEVPGGDGFTPIDAGWYPFDIDSAELVETNAKNGYYIKMPVTVLGDKFGGRKLFVQINIVNPNPTTVEIGKRELAQLGKALGIEEINDCNQLTGQFEGKVKVTPAGEKNGKSFEAGNAITAFRPIGGQQAAATPAPVPTTAAPAAAVAAPAAKPATAAKPAQGKMPWEK